MTLPWYVLAHAHSHIYTHTHARTHTHTHTHVLVPREQNAFRDRDVNDTDGCGKATGVGRSVLLSLVGPYESKFWWMKMALMFEKAVAAVVVVGIGAETFAGAWMGLGLNAATTLLSKLSAPFLNDGEDTLDVSSRVSVTLMTFLGNLLQIRAFGDAGDILGNILLFFNSLWSMAVMIYALDPVGTR